MTQVVGGLRARLIRDSLYQMIYNSLDALDWFDPMRDHAPVTFNPDEIPDLTKVALNTAALADFNVTDTEQELGSSLTEDRWTMYVDFFAEHPAVGLHFSGDVRDILLGKMTNIGRSRPDFPVYDYQQATPPLLFYCQLEDIARDRPEIFREDYQKAWYTVKFTVVDTYTNDEG